MSAFLSFYILSQQYECQYVLFMNVKLAIKHASSNAIPATHISHKFNNHLEVRFSPPHFTAVIIALHLFYRKE